MSIQVIRRSWPQRFIRSYLGWRKHLGIVISLRAAWIIANARAPAVDTTPRVPAD